MTGDRLHRFGKTYSLFGTWLRRLECVIFGHGPMLGGHCFDCGVKL